MSESINWHLFVSVDRNEYGMNLSCWLSPDDVSQLMANLHPFAYPRIGDTGRWQIHANEELTVNLCALVGEEGERILAEQKAKNVTRKLTNR